MIPDNIKNNVLFIKQSKSIFAKKNMERKNMSDLISRQAVENITWEEPSYSDPLNVLTEVREKVRALPRGCPKMMVSIL